MLAATRSSAARCPAALPAAPALVAGLGMGRVGASPRHSRPMVMVQDLAWPLPGPTAAASRSSTAAATAACAATARAEGGPRDLLFELLAGRVTEALAAQMAAATTTTSVEAPASQQPAAAASAEEDVVGQLRAADVRGRTMALHSLEAMEEWNASVAAAVRLVVVEDPSEDVRRQAVEVLACEAMRGSGPASAAVVAGLQDRVAYVREAALEALTGLSVCGPRLSVDAAADALRQLDTGCRYRNEHLDTAMAHFSDE